MAEYSRTTLNFKYGAASDYSDRLVDRTFVYDDATNTRWAHVDVVGTQTFSLANFTTVREVVLWNNDATNSSTLVFQSSVGAGQTFVIGPGKIVVLSDVVVAGNLAFTLVAGTPNIEGYVTGT